MRILEISGLTFARYSFIFCRLWFVLIPESIFVLILTLDFTFVLQGIVYALLDRKEDADKQFDIYRSLVPDEFPDKSFISDVILAAKMESDDQIQKEFGSELLSKKWSIRIFIAERLDGPGRGRYVADEI